VGDEAGARSNSVPKSPALVKAGGAGRSSPVLDSRQGAAVHPRCADPAPAKAGMAEAFPSKAALKKAAAKKAPAAKAPAKRTPASKSGAASVAKVPTSGGRRLPKAARKSGTQGQGGLWQAAFPSRQRASPWPPASPWQSRRRARKPAAGKTAPRKA
jgi:hypothetical protein